MASCPNDTPANRPSVSGPIHCFNADASVPPGGIYGYPNRPDCSDSTPSNPVGGGGVPRGAYYQYAARWLEPTGCWASLGNNQLQFVCAKDPAQYPGDRASLVGCCLGTTDPAQCRPGYCAHSAKCDTLLGSLCTGGKFAPGEDAACVAWCTGRNGRCDAGATDYCLRTGGGDTPDGKAFCACISAPEASIPGAQGIPPCFDAACVTRGYYTQAMLNLIKPGCPSFCEAAINCYQGHGSSCNISNTDFSNICGGSLHGKPWTPIGPPAPPPAPPVPPPAPPPVGLVKALFVVALFLFLVVLGLLVARRARRGPGVGAAAAAVATAPAPVPAGAG